MPLARRRIGGPGVIGLAPVARAAGTVATVAVVAHAFSVPYRYERCGFPRSRLRVTP